MKDELSQALSFDPIAEAEHQTGISYKHSEVVTMIGMAIGMEHNQKKDALLFLNDDTRFRQTFVEFCECVERMGFTKVSAERFIGSGGRAEDYLIFWHPDGVLLTAESYGPDAVNSSKAYFNYCGPREALDRCSNGWICDINGERVWDASYDAREGLRHVLDKCRAQGKILPKWRKSPFLWICTYMDTKAEGYSHIAITNKRIASLPENVRAAIK